MPNDVADWTIVNQVVPVGGLSKAILGDVAAAALSPDQGIQTFSVGATTGGAGVLASLKPAAGSTIALVGVAGAALIGSATAVNPLFGQGTVAGHLLVAWVTANGSEPTTVAAGWVKVLSFSQGGSWSAIWVRPNCGNAEAAPQFTGGGSGQLPMMAQLAEFSGAVTASPTDQTNSGNAVGSTLTLNNPAADASFGDLVMMCSRWSGFNNAPSSFVAVFNNGATAVNVGELTAHSGGAFATSAFAYAIIPVATVAQPLGVAPWAYDASGFSAPAVGTIASVVLAASAGKTYTLTLIDASMVVTTAAADRPLAQVLDGASGIFGHYCPADAVIDHGAGVSLSGLARKGTVGNSMTGNFGSAGANTLESVNIGAYLR